MDLKMAKHIDLLGLIIFCSMFTGSSGQKEIHVFSSDGEKVNLPCHNDPDCTSTTWGYSTEQNTGTTWLFIKGIKKINREKVTQLSDCSLEIYNVTTEDYGRYNCWKPLELSVVYLHFLHVSPSSSQTEIRPGSSVTLYCQLYVHHGYPCDRLLSIEGIELIWVNESGVNLQTDSRYQILSSSKHCNSSLTTTLLNEDDKTEWRCQVTKGSEVKTSASYTVTYLSSSGQKEIHVFSSDGEKVNLPCHNAPDCTSTSWGYSTKQNTGTTWLFIKGIKKINREKVTLLCDCSLEIYDVTTEDYGLYNCWKPLELSVVYLHFLHVSPSSSQTEIRPGSSVTLYCQLYVYYGYPCDRLLSIEGIELIWVNESGVNLQTDSRYQISFCSKHCNSSLTTTLLNEDDKTEWRCQVTKGSEVKTSASYTVTYFDSGTLSGRSLRVILIIVEMIALTTPTVILLWIICERRAGNKRRALDTRRHCDTVYYVNH